MFTASTDKQCKMWDLNSNQAIQVAQVKTFLHLTVKNVHEFHCFDVMHDLSNDLVPSNLKDLFVPSAKIHSYNTQASVSKNFYIQKSNIEIQRKSLSRIGAKLWNEIPTKLRALPKATFKKKIQMILLKILENEDSCKDLEFIISKVNFYSSYLYFLIQFQFCSVLDTSN